VPFLETITGAMNGTAASGQIWTASFFYRFTSAPVGITTVRGELFGFDASTITETFTFTDDTSLSQSFVRLQKTGTLANASTINVRNAIDFLFPNGVAVDFTVRIAWPQLEQSSFVSTPIRTTGVSATRGSEFPSVTPISSWYGSLGASTAGTFYMEFSLDVGVGANQFLFQFTDGTANSVIQVFVTSSGGINCQVTDATVSQATVLASVGTIVAGNVYKLAFRFAPNDFALYVNGVSQGTPDTSGTMPVLNKLYIGSNTGGSFWLFGKVRRTIFIPANLHNLNMAALTT